MLHDVVVVWQVHATMLHPGMHTSSIFNTQHVGTWGNSGVVNVRNMLRPTMLRYIVLKCWDRLTGACKCWANNVGICCVDMLRSFGRSLTLNLPIMRCAFVRLIVLAHVFSTMVCNAIMWYTMHLLGTHTLAWRLQCVYKSDKKWCSTVYHWLENVA